MPAAAPATKLATKAAPKTAAAKTAPKAAKAAAKAAEDVALPADGTAAEVAHDAAKKPRVQLASVLQINISQARCATHLKQNLGDEGIEAEIKGLRDQLKVAKAANDAVKIVALKTQITALSKTLVRISSETPIAAAVLWDGAVKELLRHGMDQAIAGERKIVDTVHLHSGGPEELIYHPLYSKCAAWSEYDPKHEEALKKERAVLNKAAKEQRDAKKAEAAAAAAAAEAPAEPKAGKATAKAAKAAAVVAAETDEDEEDHEHAEHTKTTFYTYVENALKTVKKDDPYKSMRVSNRVREYLSGLVAQGIARMALLSRIIVQRVVDVRTMNADHVKAVVHVLMADEGRTSGQIDMVAAQIDEKLKVYHAHLATEKTNKAEALDETKKCALECKKREADLTRKTKQAELAKKRAIEAAQKAKDLAVEMAALAPIVAADHAAAEAAAASIAAAAIAEATPATA